MSALYPQLIPVPEGTTTAPTLDQPPTYTDLFNQYFGDDVTPDAGMDDLIAQLDALNTGFAAEIPDSDQDVAALDAVAPDGDAAFDTSGGDAIAAAYPGVQSDAAAVCRQFQAVLSSTGVTPTGKCDAGAVSPTPVQPTGPGGGTPTAPSNNPYPQTPDPPPDGQQSCSDSGTPINIQLTMPDLIEGGVPGTLLFNNTDWGNAASSFYVGATVFSGPQDMVFVNAGHPNPVSLNFYTSYVITVYPRRPGTFYAGIFWFINPDTNDYFYACLKFTVQPANGQPEIPGATQSTPQELLASVQGQRLARQVLVMPNSTLGDQPNVWGFLNSDIGDNTSGWYTDGEIVAGPADMFVTFGKDDDEASPGAFRSVETIVYPIRVGTWAWLVKYYEDAAHTLPVYFVYTATVNAAGGS